MDKLHFSEATIFHPVWFHEKEIAMFNTVSCNNIISVATTVSNPKSPLFVNFAILTNFAKLYIHYWNREIHAFTLLATEQRTMLENLLLKITQVYALAHQQECAINYWVDLPKLLKITIESKKENLFLALHPHHEYDILEIEKVGLEFAKTEVITNILNEAKIKDLIMFSRLMAFQLHGIKLLS